MISRSGCMTDKQKKELKDHGSAAFPLACYQNDADALITSPRPLALA